MRVRKFCFAAGLILLAVGLCAAKDFWDESFTKWKRNQVLRLLSDSPWAQSQTISNPVLSKDAGVGGEKELNYQFTVRFFSALPVREAYVRMYQLMNKYDDMNPQQRQEFDAKFNRGLELDVHDRIILAMEFASNDPDVSRNMKEALRLARTEAIKQQVYLITQRLGRVELLAYYPPSPDGTGAKFVFPRLVDGKPIVEPDDKEVRFDFFAPVVNQRIFVTFTVAKMSYEGKLSY